MRGKQNQGNDVCQTWEQADPAVVRDKCYGKYINYIYVYIHSYVVRCFKFLS